MSGLGYSGLGYSFYHFLWNALDWLYPPVCAGCNQPGSRWCANCQDKAIPIQKPICRICGDPIKTGALCNSCTSKAPSFTALRSWAEFESPVRDALISLKYRSNIGIGELLAQPLIEIYTHEKWSVDLVVPIPLSKEHLNQRGYNQAAFIAKPLALKLQIPYQPQSIHRVKETVSQIHLSAAERYTNLHGAFSANPATLNGKKVLLIDDVTTTGATMKSCADAARQAGAIEIYGLTVARALKKQP